MDFVIRRHMLLKEERKWLILTVRVQRSHFTQGSRAIYASSIETDKRQMCVWIWIFFKVCEFTLPFTNRFWTISKHVSFIYSSGYGPPFHFLSQRSKSTDLWSAAQPLNNSWHWLVFSPYFSPCLFLSLSFFFWSAHMVVLWEAFIHLAHL